MNKHTTIAIPIVNTQVLSRSGSDGFDRRLSYEIFYTTDIADKAAMENSITAGMSSSRRKYLPQEVMLLILKRLPEIRKDVMPRQGSFIQRDVVHCAFSCPQGVACIKGGQITFEKSRGYANAFSHLRSCLANRNDENLLVLYNEALSEQLLQS